MLDNNEMIDFFDGWNEKPENRDSGLLIEKLTASHTHGMVVGDVSHAHSLFGNPPPIAPSESQYADPSNFLVSNPPCQIHGDEVKVPEILKTECGNITLADDPMFVSGASLASLENCVIRTAPATCWGDSLVDQVNDELQTLKTTVDTLRDEVFALRIDREPETPVRIDIAKSRDTTAVGWFDTERKTMQNMTTASPDHFSELERKIEAYQYDRMIAEATVTAPPPMQFTASDIALREDDFAVMHARMMKSKIDHLSESEMAAEIYARELATSIDNDILADLQKMIEHMYVDDNKNFEHAMELAK